MTDIFLSYAREDQARIAPLAAALAAAGFDVWWDRRLVGGAEFSKETEEQLNKARVIVVAWSKAASESMWVADEATVGRNKGNLVPIAFDGAEPRIGFRQIQTIDFSGWRGGADETPASSLVEALRARLGSAPKADPPVAPQPRRRLHAAAGLAAIAAIGFAAFLASEIDAGADAPPTEQVAAAPDGPDSESLDVLESLAADLERRGELKAASAAYTRVAAKALLVDRGRGLAARRKALDLDPHSPDALQGLLFDINLIKGAEEAIRMGEEFIRRPDTPPRQRALALALVGVLEIDLRMDLEAGRRKLAALETMQDAAGDLFIEHAALWLGSLVDLRLNDPEGAMRRARRAEEIQRTQLPDTPRNGEVMVFRIMIETGDWEGLMSYGPGVIERRKRNGEFLAYPILDAVCRAGVYLDRVADVAGYCVPISSKGERSGDTRAKLNAALYDAGLGRFDDARRELDAARALGHEGAIDGGEGRLLPLQIRLIEGVIAVRNGDLEEAGRLMDAGDASETDNDLVRASEKRVRVVIARLVAAAMLRDGPGEAACGAAARAAALYRQMNAAPGAAAVEATARKAGC